MSLFEQLMEDYERRFSQMSVTPAGVRFLKLRTLIDIETLKASEKLRNLFDVKKSKINRRLVKEIRKKYFYDKSLTNNQLDKLLKEVYKELKKFRNINFELLKSNLEKVAKEGDEYWKAWNSVYRDDIRQHIQHHFVRTLSIQSYEKLLKEIEKRLDPVVKGYTVISWFNQWSSAIIEDFILSHPRVVPTARRIDKVDFFFLDIPMDLKITFVPAEYIRLSLKKGVISTQQEIVEYIQREPLKLIKWLYQNQGERRFSDSHRLFIVLVDRKDLEKSWKLKACFDLIKNKINSFLNSRQAKREIQVVEWEFNGDRIKGKFKTYSEMVLIIKDE